MNGEEKQNGAGGEVVVVDFHGTGREKWGGRELANCVQVFVVFSLANVDASLRVLLSTSPSPF